jgi:hypothetical protein
MVQGIGFDEDACDEGCCEAGSGREDGSCCSIGDGRRTDSYAGCGTGAGYGIRTAGGTLFVQVQGRGSIDYRKLLLNWAKTELLKEKVKAKLDKKYGKELEALADALVEVMSEEGAQKKEIGKKKEETRKKLKSFLEDGEVV